mgnify:CR=1 FL=1
MAFSHNPKIVTDGLIICLDAADKNSYPGSGTTWTELVSNNGYSLSNGPTFNSENGGSIDFDGTNDYFDTGLTGGIYNPQFFTMDIWLRLNSTKSTYGLCGRLDNTFTQGITFYGANSTAHFTVNTYNSDLASTSISTGVINNYHCSYDESTLKLYKDGSLVSSTSYDVAVTYNSSYGWNVATNSTGVGLSLSPDMNCYSFRVYNRALSADEVLQNYNATKSRFGL